MIYSTARDAIVRKFTNYRNHQKEVDFRGCREALAMKELSKQLADLKTFSRGKTLFKKRNSDLISAEQETLLELNPNMLPVVAYQKAVMSLWSQEDKELWDKLAEGEIDDGVYEYICCSHRLLL